MCPFTHLTSVHAVLNPELVKLGAEDCSAHDKGAYTGEVSAAMVKSTGAEYVILGHSERRQYFGEDNELLLAKTKLALENGLRPIFCVGEVLEQREDGSYNDVVKGQVEALFSLSAEDFAKIVIAYEPVWAIGTGKTATADQAQDMHAHIRKVVEDKYGKRKSPETAPYCTEEAASRTMHRRFSASPTLTAALSEEPHSRQTLLWESSRHSVDEFPYSRQIDNDGSHGRDVIVPGHGPVSVYRTAGTGQSG